jgi:DNA-binding MarR family transcriptional regulator
MPRSRTRSVRARSRSSAPTPARPIDLGILPTLLGFNIRRAQIALWRDFTRSVAEGEVRPGVFSVLSLASSNPGIAQIDIANQLDIDKASVVALIDWLENQGWVARERSATDRRRHEISVTRAGRKAYRTLKREMIEHEKKFAARFTEAERKQLIALLQRLHG